MSAVSSDGAQGVEHLRAARRLLVSAGMKLGIVVLLFCACGGTRDGDTNDAGNLPDDSTTAACETDADCGAGMKCTAEKICVGGCGAEALDLTYVPPNLIVVLDRSCSMNQKPTGATQTKWASAVGALGTILQAHQTDIDWGLTLFPDTTGATCAQDANAVPIGPNNAMTIKTLLTNALATTDPLFPDGPCVTNIDTGLQAAALDPALSVAGKSSYVMLVTDGAQSSCTVGGGDAGSEAAIADLYTKRGIKTFVVGFGGGVDAAQLNEFATLGGAPLAGATKYYQADTAAQLQQAFQSISELVVSCEYVVDPAPPDLGQTYVYFEDTELVPRDPTHVAGWDYDPATMKLTLYGSYCDRLENRSVDDVDVIYGCPLL